MGICRSCRENVKPWLGPICFQCGLPLASAIALDSKDCLCGECRQQVQAFDLARSYGVYSGNLRAAILQVKFNRCERLGRRLGELLAGPCLSLKEFQDAGSPVVIPVPLHRQRERERGFNQAKLLAQGLGRKLGERNAMPAPLIDSKSLIRSHATPPQTGLSVSARHENMRGVFEVRSPERVRDRVVVLVDDVMTTGATLSACAAALKRAGASLVLAVTLARATPQIPDTVSLASVQVDGTGMS